MSGKVIKTVINRIRNAERVLDDATWVIFAGLLFLGTADVIGRYFFNKPITGARELSFILLVAIVLFGWAHTQAQGAHIRLDLVISRLPPRVRAIMNLATLFLCLALVSLIVWQGANTAIFYWKSGALVPVVLIPQAPFQLIVPIGAFILCLEFIIEIIELLRGMKGAA